MTVSGADFGRGSGASQTEVAAFAHRRHSCDSAGSACRQSVARGARPHRRMDLCLGIVPRVIHGARAPRASCDYPVCQGDAACPALLRYAYNKPERACLLVQVDGQGREALAVNQQCASPVPRRRASLPPQSGVDTLPEASAITRGTGYSGTMNPLHLVPSRWSRGTMAPGSVLEGVRSTKEQMVAATRTATKRVPAWCQHRSTGGADPAVRSGQSPHHSAR